jgi:hypothetical protein
MTCLDEIFTFDLGITFIGAPVYFWIFSAWMGMRFHCFKRDNVFNNAVHDVLVS